MQERQESASRGTGFSALYEFVLRFGGTEHDNSELDAAAAEVLGALDEAGVDVLLLKGPALGALLYGASQRRSYSDVDLLVAPSALDAAADVLAGLGYSNAHAVQGVDDVGGVVHGEAWIQTSRGSAEQPSVDLHRTLPGARAEPSVVWKALASRRIEIEVGGRQAAALDRVGQAMHLAIHAAQHGPRFEKHLNELGLAIARWPADAWASAARLAVEVEAIDAFAAGLRLVPVGAVLASELGLPSTAELDWAIRHADSRPRGTFHLRAFAEATGPGERLQIMRRSLLPPRAWVTHQHPWAADGRLRLTAAYGLHLLRAPVWGARAWLYTPRAQRAARR